MAKEFKKMTQKEFNKLSLEEKRAYHHARRRAEGVNLESTEDRIERLRAYAKSFNKHTFSNFTSQFSVHVPWKAEAPKGCFNLVRCFTEEEVKRAMEADSMETYNKGE